LKFNRAIKMISLFTTMLALSTYAYADEWWVLNYHELTCATPLVDQGVTYTPEQMVKIFNGCFSEPFDNGNGIYLNCDSSRLKTNFIFTKTLADCKKWAEKLRPLRQHGKGVPRSGK